MAVPFGTAIPGLVTLRVYRAGEHARVRVWVGQDGSAGLTGELVMTPADWRQFRALLPERDPRRLAIHYANGEVFDWLTTRAEAVP
jgi:hypothetical protein